MADPSKTPTQPDRPHGDDHPMVDSKAPEMPQPPAKRSPPKRRCKAHNRQGKQCGQAPAIGQEVCRLHGGASPQAVAKAQQRLRDAADRMAMRLLGMADSDNVPAYVALQAVNSALDRAGVVEPQQVDVTVRPFEQLLEDVTGGSRADYRRSIGDERADDLPRAIEATHHNRPGGEPSGVRVLGELPDGSLVIDGELADDDQDSRTHPAGERVPTDADHVGRDTLVNHDVPLTPVRGYLPGDLAMEQAAEANRAYRRGLNRR